VLGDFSLLPSPLFAGVREIFAHSDGYTASRQHLMLLKNHPAKMALMHAKQNVKIRRKMLAGNSSS